MMVLSYGYALIVSSSATILFRRDDRDNGFINLYWLIVILHGGSNSQGSEDKSEDG